jgi:dodecin
MAESVYRVTELVGVSSESWEAAARNAIETAAKTLRDLRIAEAHRFDVTIENGQAAHHAWMRAASVLASQRPWRVRGCLPGVGQSPRPQLQRP